MVSQEISSTQPWLSPVEVGAMSASLSSCELSELGFTNVCNSQIQMFIYSNSNWLNKTLFLNQEEYIYLTPDSPLRDAHSTLRLHHPSLTATRHTMSNSDSHIALDAIFVWQE